MEAFWDRDSISLFKSELLRGKFHFLLKSGFLEIKFYLKLVYIKFLAKYSRRIYIETYIKLLKENLRDIYARELN